MMHTPHTVVKKWPSASKTNIYGVFHFVPTLYHTSCAAARSYWYKSNHAHARPAHRHTPKGSGSLVVRPRSCRISPAGAWFELFKIIYIYSIIIGAGRRRQNDAKRQDIIRGIQMRGPKALRATGVRKARWAAKPLWQVGKVCISALRAVLERAANGGLKRRPLSSVASLKTHLFYKKCGGS